MAGYDSYRDTNGVTWTVVWPASAKGYTAIATVLEDADPKYGVDPGDLAVSMAQGGIQIGRLDIVPSAPATEEQRRVLFIELTQKIQVWANAHAGIGVTLKVTASPPLPWWLYLLGALVLIKRR